MRREIQISAHILGAKLNFLNDFCWFNDRMPVQSYSNSYPHCEHHPPPLTKCGITLLFHYYSLFMHGVVAHHSIASTKNVNNVQICR